MSNLASVPVETLGEVYSPNDGTIQLDVWRRVLVDGVPSGTIRREKGRPVGEIVSDIEKKIRRLVDEYFTLGGSFKYPVGGGTDGHLTECPKVQRIAVFTVTGGSEGHYVHVDLYVEEDRKTVVKNLALLKTFKGKKHARRVEARIADLLGV